MKYSQHLKFVAILFGCLFVSATYAQSDKDEISIVQNLYGMEKKEVVKVVMELTDIDASKFWPVYDAYEIERKKLGADRIAIIMDYAKNFETLNDAKADELAMRVFKNDLAFDKLHKSYYAKVKKALSPLKAAQFMQVESYMQNAIRYAISEELPFIGALKR